MSIAYCLKKVIEKTILFLTSTYSLIINSSFLKIPFEQTKPMSMYIAEEKATKYNKFIIYSAIIVLRVMLTL